MKRIINASTNDDLYFDMLNYIADRFKVNGPKYRGAPQPEFNPAMVNESAYLDNMRFKQFDCDVEGDEIHIWYLTQEPFTYAEAKECAGEIERCIDFLYDKYCEEVEESVDPPYVYLIIESRYGREYGYYEATYV